MKHPLAGSAAVILLLGGCGSREKAAPEGAATPAGVAPTTTTTTTTTLPPPPPAWRAARWKMSRAEVLAAFPGEAQRLSQPAPFGPTAPGSTDIAIASHEGDGARFRVLFGFDDNGLARVHLNAIKPGDSTCGEVENALTGKLGQPAARNDTGTSLRGQETVWKHPDHTVTLSCAGVHSLGFRTVTVSYTPPG